MKRKLFTMLLLVFSGIVWGQDNGNITGNYYITIVDIPVIEHNLKNGKTKTDTLIAKKGTKFTVIEVLDSKIILKFWRFEGGKQPTEDKSKENIDPEEPNIYINKTANGKHYEMKVSDFDVKTKNYYGKSNSFTWGFTVLPIKLRFGSDKRLFEHSGGFSLGINAGYEYCFKGLKQQSISVLAGVAISTVPVSDKTTNGFLDIGEVTTVGAFTPSLGVVYTYEQFQIGLFSGVDFIGGELGKNWMYRNKPWLGVGLGFTIFQKNKTTSDENQTQN